MQSHSHDFDESEWPFRERINVPAYTTRQVLKEGYPVLLVSHDSDGDWQFLCDTTLETDDLRVVCLGCAYQQDKTVGKLADLPKGWMASRSSIDEPWERFQNELSVESDES